MEAAPPPARSEQEPVKKFSVPFRRNWSRAKQKTVREISAKLPPER